jgi:hypothetical protein
MQTGIATAIFLTSVVLTLFLYYYKIVRKKDAAESVEKHTFLVSSTLAAIIFFGTLLIGVNIVLFFLAFAFLFFLLLVDR